MELNTLFNTQQAHAVQLRIEPLRNRKERLKKLLSWVLNHEKEIKDALRKDLGKPEMESDVSEIFPVISEIRMALANIGRWTKPQFVDTPLHFLGSSGRIHYVPKGVCLILSTWNFPFNLSVIPLISALTAGNSVILKPSEISPNTSKVLKKMCDEVFDPKVVAVVEGGIEVSQELLNLPFNHMYFVGSTKVGKIVMEAASKHLASVTLELGGKSPSIVDESADLADAAQ
ncbi:MAG: aldehyde dehydrogenase family protein, partial [Cyclobacteriaceae bacterium]|nr:aldehyde dehydrogenase family protein [Cyclobacteriaceae bacterium]